MTSTDQLKESNLKLEAPDTREDVVLSIRVGSRLENTTRLNAQTPLEVNTILQAYLDMGGKLGDLDLARATPA